MYTRKRTIRIACRSVRVKLSVCSVTLYVSITKTCADNKSRTCKNNSKEFVDMDKEVVHESTKVPFSRITGENIIDWFICNKTSSNIRISNKTSS